MLSTKRNGSMRASALILTVVAMALGAAVWSAWAQETPSKPEDQKIQQSIRNALEGSSETAAPEEPLLQDVLDLIQRQGSILDGSMLDATAEQPDRQSASDEASYNAAEALLKAARLLQQLPSDSETSAQRRPLIQQMRRQASQILQTATMSSGSRPSVR